MEPVACWLKCCDILKELFMTCSALNLRFISANSVCVQHVNLTKNCAYVMLCQCYGCWAERVRGVRGVQLIRGKHDECRTNPQLAISLSWANSVAISNGFWLRLRSQQLLQLKQLLQQQQLLLQLALLLLLRMRVAVQFMKFRNCHSACWAISVRPSA